MKKKNFDSFDCLVFTIAVYSKIEWNYVKLLGNFNIL